MEKLADIDRFIDGAGSIAGELEAELSRCPAISPDAGGTGELAKCTFLEEWLVARGIDQLERFDAPDERADGGVRPNLIATIAGADDSRRLWIMSHLDVVPPGEAKLWHSDPWTVLEKDDAPLGARFIGRGVQDNQQGLISSVLAALALLKTDVTPAHTVKLLFAADEEMGSEYGIQWLLKNHGGLFRREDAALIPDGGDSKGESIEIAEKNLLWLKITTTGEQAHASRPDQGNNACLVGAYLTVALYEGLSAKFSARDLLFTPAVSTFQPTKHDANVPNVNTIPPLDEVYAEIDAIIERIEERFGVSVKHETLQRSESAATRADSPFVARLSRAVKDVYQVQTHCVGIGGGTVAAPLRNRGMDAAVWARLDDMAHQPNEYALLANILGDAKVMARLMIGE